MFDVGTLWSRVRGGHPSRDWSSGQTQETEDPGRRGGASKKQGRKEMPSHTFSRFSFPLKIHSIHSSKRQVLVLGDIKLNKTERENRHENQQSLNRGTPEMPSVIQESIERHQLTRTCTLSKVTCQALLHLPAHSVQNIDLFNVLIQQMKKWRL